MIIDPAKEPDGVIFILHRSDDKVLLIQRDENSKLFPNTWAFPGGSCDDGEDFLHACIREAEEEFEAKLTEADCSLLMKRLNNHNWVYVCSVDDDFIPRQHEGKDMAWSTFEEISKLELGYEQADIVPLLKEYITNLKF